MAEEGIRQEAGAIIAAEREEVWARAQALWADYVEAMREVLALGVTGHSRYSWNTITEHLNSLTHSGYRELNGEGIAKTNAMQEKARQRYSDLIAPVGVARS